MYLDAVVIAIIGLIAYLVSHRLDLFERTVQFSRTHETWELDEVFVALVILTFCLLVFAFRRWRDLVSETEKKSEALEKNEMLIAELRETLNQVERLETLLPICSNCHSIRNDQGYWQRVESYFQDHTGASFSHSICPECLKKLYPEFYDEIMDEMAAEENEKPAPNTIPKKQE